ncbi:hypothetical protein ACEWY4_010639 [Coilia grayii]|uniref:CBM21 domain-containing protein n=1 Tax=Coilia grayii TaxID=363190 RepID=A0ABD1K2H4_9TELE
MEPARPAGGPPAPVGFSDYLAPPGPWFLGVEDREEEEEEDEDVEIRGGIRPKSSPLPRRRTSESALDDCHEQLPPPSATRRVSFADSHGLTLMSVRWFGSSSNNGWDVTGPSGGLPGGGEPEGLLEEYFLSPVFASPLPHEELQSRVQEQKLELESLTLLPGTTTLRGVVRVLNICYSKTVYVRASLDCWKSHFDLLAEYVPESTEDRTDCFSFKHTLVPQASDDGARLDFCLRYETDLGTFWANNGGHNYVVFCHKKTHGPTQMDTCPKEGRLVKKSCLKTVSKYSSMNPNTNEIPDGFSPGDDSCVKQHLDTPSEAQHKTEQREKLMEERKQNHRRRRRRRAVKLALAQDYFANKDTEDKQNGPEGMRQPLQPHINNPHLQNELSSDDITLEKPSEMAGALESHSAHDETTSPHEQGAEICSQPSSSSHKGFTSEKYPDIVPCLLGASEMDLDSKDSDLKAITKQEDMGTKTVGKSASEQSEFGETNSKFKKTDASLGGSIAETFQESSEKDNTNLNRGNPYTFETVVAPLYHEAFTRMDTKRKRVNERELKDYLKSDKQGDLNTLTDTQNSGPLVTKTVSNISEHKIISDTLPTHDKEYSYLAQKDDVICLTKKAELRQDIACTDSGSQQNCSFEGLQNTGDPTQSPDTHKDMVDPPLTDPTQGHQRVTPVTCHTSDTDTENYHELKCTVNITYRHSSTPSENINCEVKKANMEVMPHNSQEDSEEQCIVPMVDSLLQTHFPQTVKGAAIATLDDSNTDVTKEDPNPLLVALSDNSTVMCDMQNTELENVHTQTPEDSEEIRMLTADEPGSAFYFPKPTVREPPDVVVTLQDNHLTQVEISHAPPKQILDRTSGQSAEETQQMTSTIAPKKPNVSMETSGTVQRCDEAEGSESREPCLFVSEKQDVPDTRSQSSSLESSCPCEEIENNTTNPFTTLPIFITSEDTQGNVGVTEINKKNNNGEIQNKLHKSESRKHEKTELTVPRDGRQPFQGQNSDHISEKNLINLDSKSPNSLSCNICPANGQETSVLLSRHGEKDQGLAPTSKTYKAIGSQTLGMTNGPEGMHQSLHPHINNPHLQNELSSDDVTLEKPAEMAGASVSHSAHNETTSPHEAGADICSQPSSSSYKGFTSEKYPDIVPCLLEASEMDLVSKDRDLKAITKQEDTGAKTIGESASTQSEFGEPDRKFNKKTDKESVEERITDASQNSQRFRISDTDSRIDRKRKMMEDYNGPSSPDLGIVSMEKRSHLDTKDTGRKIKYATNYKNLPANLQESSGEENSGRMSQTKNDMFSKRIEDFPQPATNPDILITDTNQEISHSHLPLAQVSDTTHMPKENAIQCDDENTLLKSEDLEQSDNALVPATQNCIRAPGYDTLQLTVADQTPENISVLPCTREDSAHTTHEQSSAPLLFTVLKESQGEMKLAELDEDIIDEKTETLRDLQTCETSRDDEETIMTVPNETKLSDKGQKTPTRDYCEENSEQLESSFKDINDQNSILPANPLESSEVPFATHGDKDPALTLTSNKDETTWLQLQKVTNNQLLHVSDTENRMEENHDQDGNGLSNADSDTRSMQTGSNLDTKHTNNEGEQYSGLMSETINDTFSERQGEFSQPATKPGILISNHSPDNYHSRLPLAQTSDTTHTSNETESGTKLGQNMSVQLCTKDEEMTSITPEELKTSAISTGCTNNQNKQNKCEAKEETKPTKELFNGVSSTNAAIEQSSTGQCDGQEETVDDLRQQPLNDIIMTSHSANSFYLTQMKLLTLTPAPTQPGDTSAVQGGSEKTDIREESNTEHYAEPSTELGEDVYDGEQQTDTQDAVIVPECGDVADDATVSSTGNCRISSTEVMIGEADICVDSMTALIGQKETDMNIDLVMTHNKSQFQLVEGGFESMEEVTEEVARRSELAKNEDEVYQHHTEHGDWAYSYCSANSVWLSKKVNHVSESLMEKVSITAREPVRQAVEEDSDVTGSGQGKNTMGNGQSEELPVKRLVFGVEAAIIQVKDMRYESEEAFQAFGQTGGTPEDEEEAGLKESSFRVDEKRGSESDSDVDNASESLSDDEMELYMHALRASQKSLVKDATCSGKRDSSIPVFKRPSISKTSKALPSITESVDEEDRLPDVQTSEQNINHHLLGQIAPPACENVVDTTEENWTRWTECLSFENVSRVFVCMLLFVIFMVTTYYYDFLACLVLYVLTAYWLCCQSETPQVK